MTNTDGTPVPADGPKRVSKRLRFEVLNRDNHTCRYCGGRAPDVELTVDHVVPVALGGANVPGNLVAACRDCNAGKSSSHPDAARVAEVDADALRWAEAMKAVAAQERQAGERRASVRRTFFDEWSRWKFDATGETVPLPSDWEQSIDQFIEAGMTIDDLTEFVRIAMTKPGVSGRDTFRYMCGVGWRTLTNRQEAARALLRDEGV